MRTNPEFLRNLWLEFSWHRLLATPAILLLLFYLIGSLGSQSAVLAASMLGFFGLTAFWGSQQAAGSLLREIQGGTWPSQRLTAIEPWPMTWGKLLGSTAYPWYAGAWCLLVFVLTGRSVADRMQAWGMIGNSLFLTVIYCVGLALLFQTSALLGALIQSSRQRVVARRRSLVLIISLLILGLFLVQVFSRVAGIEEVNWWGGGWSGRYFWLLSLLAFIGWALIGSTMLMRRELQVANTPWVWLSFLAFIGIYFSGFVQLAHFAAFGSPEVTALRLGVVLAITLLLSYVMVFFERTTIVDISRLLQRWRARAWIEAFSETPRWVLTALAAWLAGLLFIISLQWLGYSPAGSPGPDLYALALAALCFLMRDLAVVMIFNFSGKADRSGMTALIYLAVLYLLLPWLLGVLGLDNLLHWLLPTGRAGIVGAVLPALIQAMLSGLVLVRRWRRRAVLSQVID